MRRKQESQVPVVLETRKQTTTKRYISKVKKQASCKDTHLEGNLLLEKSGEQDADSISQPCP